MGRGLRAPDVADVNGPGRPSGHDGADRGRGPTTDGSKSASWLADPERHGWRSVARPRRARAFHDTLPGFAPTDLVDLSTQATELGIGGLVVKDESRRLGLGSFKGLGVSWAIACLVSARTGVATNAGIRALRTACRVHPFTLVTATEGNHGRAMARMARLLGLPAHVVVPGTTSPATISSIERERATVEQVGGDYDAAVARAVAVAARSGDDAELVQDMAWDGYEQVPDWIVTGYTTMLWEVEEQLAAGDRTAAVVVVPVGVGSLAHAVVDHFRRAEIVTPATVVVVEPDTAACLMASLALDRATTVATGETVMAGLNCPTPSSTAWPDLRNGVAAAVAVTDDQALQGAADLVAMGVSSGPCGGATLAGARVLLGGPDGDRARRLLDLDDRGVVVLLNTEAATT